MSRGRANHLKLLRNVIVAWAALTLTFVLALGQTEVSAPLLLGGTAPGMSTYSITPMGNSAFVDGGRHSDLKAQPLLKSQPVRESLASGVYVSQVGGVAFDQVARPHESLQIESMKLAYFRRASDGTRVRTNVNGINYKIDDLYDWQVVPIARFADSSYPAIVTLFGKLEGDVAPAEVQGQYVIGFHPAFQGTLLGLRMFQSDFLLLDASVAGELPRLGNKHLIGAGEFPPSRLWSPAATKLNSLMARQSFVSYVICDFNGPPKFQIQQKGAKLVISGNPYFYFWRRGATKAEVVVEDDGPVTYSNSFEVEHVSELSSVISGSTQDLELANPAVYNSLVTVMRCSAFFRYCKERDPEMWRKFLADVEQVPERIYQAPSPVLMPRRPL